MSEQRKVFGSIVLAGGTVGGAGTRAALESATDALAGCDAAVIAPPDWAATRGETDGVSIVARRWVASIAAELVGFDRADHYIGFADRLPLFGRAGRRSQVMVVQNLFLYLDRSDWEDANRAKVAVLRWWARRSVTKADTVIVSSQGSADALFAATSADPDRVVVRPIPVPDPGRIKVDHAPQIETIVLVGDLYRHKRFDLAVDAVAAFADDADRSCKVIHFGGDLEGPAVEAFDVATARAAGSGVVVERRGSVSRSAVLDAMVDADVTLLLSTTETQGIPLREAMVVGLPVICEATDVFVEQGGEAVEAVEADGPDRVANVEAVVEGLRRIDDIEVRRHRSDIGRRLAKPGAGWWLLAHDPQGDAHP